MAGKEHDEVARRGCADAELEHDPEKWEPIFGEDHALVKSSARHFGQMHWPFTQWCGGRQGGGPFGTH